MAARCHCASRDASVHPGGRTPGALRPGMRGVNPGTAACWVRRRSCSCLASATTDAWWRCWWFRNIRCSRRSAGPRRAGPRCWCRSSAPCATQLSMISTPFTRKRTPSSDTVRKRVCAGAAALPLAGPARREVVGVDAAAGRCRAPAEVDGLGARQHRRAAQGRVVEVAAGQARARGAGSAYRRARFFARRSRAGRWPARRGRHR